MSGGDMSGADMRGANMRGARAEATAGKPAGANAGPTLRDALAAVIDRSVLPLVDHAIDRWNVDAPRAAVAPGASRPRVASTAQHGASAG